MNLRGLARNRLYALNRHLRAAETTVPRVELFIAVGILVGFGRFAVLSFVLRRGADIHPLADALGDTANLSAARIAVGREEADIGKEYISCEIRAFQKQSRRDPGLPL